MFLCCDSKHARNDLKYNELDKESTNTLTIPGALTYTRR